MRAATKLAWSIVVLLALSTPAWPHGPLQVQIDEASAAIERHPADARLYVKRGELLRLHEEWDAALADYLRAATLAPDDDSIDFLRGRALQEAQRFDAARVELDRYLARHPEHAAARIARARTLHALGDNRRAAADYDVAIERIAKPDPDLYLERARAEMSAKAPARALAGIDAGLARLGPIPALQEAGIGIEIEQGHADAALARIDVMAQAAPRKETLLVRRGEILLRAGRESEARL